VFLAARSIGTLGIRQILRIRSSWIVYGLRHAGVAAVKRLANPAIAFMGFPLGHAISIQGMRIVIGTVLGPPAVVVFSTLRTLTRLGFQVINMITNTVWPELSMALGAKDMELVRKLHRHSCQISLWLALCAVAGLLVTGGWIIHTWTLGKVVMDATLFNLLLAVIIANSIWYTSSAVPLAINRHQRIALCYLIGTSLSLLIALVLMTHLGLSGAALALFCIDLLMTTYVIRTSLTLSHDNFSQFIGAIIIPPYKELGTLMP